MQSQTYGRAASGIEASTSLRCPGRRRSHAAFSSGAAHQTTQRQWRRAQRQQHAVRAIVAPSVDEDIDEELAARHPAGSSTAPGSQRQAQQAPTDVQYDAIVIGGGMGGLTTATQMAAKGAKVLVLEKYIIPGGSAGRYEREGYIFDVGSSMMFGMGSEGTTNLITRALAAVGRSMETVPDPTQIHYRLPKSERHPEGLEVRVWRDYEKFVAELTERFPHEATGIRKFYDECWREEVLPDFPPTLLWEASGQVFNSLNTLELKSLEEPRYLLGEFAKHPLACLTLASFLTTNSGDVARRHIKDPELLSFIDIECYCWSTVLAEFTPMINAGMVFCDRHYGGINYPRGGVGRIAEELVAGLQEHGGAIEYKANVREILTEGNGADMRATGVRLADGRIYRGKTVVSNATRWDTFEGLMPKRELPKSEQLFRARYKKSPSFLSIHMGVRADVFGPGTECHQIIVEEWAAMEQPHGTIFVSIPSLLDASIAPDGCHVMHVFTPDWVDNWTHRGSTGYEDKKREVVDSIIRRLEPYFPGLSEGIVFREAGTPRTHRRFLGRADGSYGPIPSRRPLGMLGMPMNRTAIKGLYCVGDSTFPGQGVNAVVFSGFGCAHRVLCDLGMEPTLPVIDGAYNKLLSAARDAA